jgi:hypothetical protein
MSQRVLASRLTGIACLAILSFGLQGCLAMGVAGAAVGVAGAAVGTTVKVVGATAKAGVDVVGGVATAVTGGSKSH